MNSQLIGAMIAVAALLSFAVSGRGRAWWFIALGLLLAGAGAYGVWLIEKGPQKAFKHYPISAPNLAWLSGILVFAGAGVCVGALVRGGLWLARKRR